MKKRAYRVWERRDNKIYISSSHNTYAAARRAMEKTERVFFEANPHALVSFCIAYRGEDGKYREMETEE